MNKILSTLLVGTVAIGATSCEDFLDKHPFDRVDPQETVTDEVATAMTNACYLTLQSSNMYNQRIWTLDIVAGNSIVGGSGGDDGLETVQASNFTTMSDNGMALYMWRSPWVGIGHCNDAILAVENNENLSTEIHDRCLGEALFLRAHYYYVLARLYGGLPLRTEPYVPGEDSAIARSSLEDTYELIISDLTRALDLLPAKADYDAANVGRASKDAALYMLADVYLTLAPSNPSLYADVVDLCNRITALGYNLDACSYADNFNPLIDNGPESIFEVQYSGSIPTDMQPQIAVVLSLAQGTSLVTEGVYGANRFKYMDDAPVRCSSALSVRGWMGIPTPKAPTKTAVVRFWWSIGSTCPRTPCRSSPTTPARHWPSSVRISTATPPTSCTSSALRAQRARRPPPC